MPASKENRTSELPPRSAKTGVSRLRSESAEPLSVASDNNNAAQKAPQRIAIGTVEHLRYILESGALDPTCVYDVSIDGPTVVYGGNESELYFSLLSFWPLPQTQVLVVREDEFLTTLKAFGMQHIHQHVPTALLQIPILNALACVSYDHDKQCIQTPSGSFAFDPCVGIDGRYINPVASKMVKDTYRPILQEDPARLEAVLDNNFNSLSGILTLVSKTVEEAGGKIIDSNPEFKEIPHYSKIVFHLKLLVDIFKNNVLPQLMLHPEIKNVLQVSLLTPALKLDDNQVETVVGLLYYFMSQCPFIRKISRLTRSFQETAARKHKLIAEADVRGGVQNAESIARRNDSELTRNVSKHLYSQSSNTPVIEHFWTEEIPGLGIDRVEFKLHGKIASASAVEKLEQLRNTHPNFGKVVDHLLPFARASFIQSSAFQMPPLLIAGPPGIGKSKFLSDLRDVLNMGRTVIHATQLTTGSQLVGMAKSWSNGHQGQVADAMMEIEATNPVVVFDELDKIPSSWSGNGVPIFPTLMRLLEPAEAVNFQDSFHNEPHDVSHVNWLFTCNNPRAIPYALMTRIDVLYVYPPRKQEEIDNVHNIMWRGIIQGLRVQEMVYEQIDPDVIVSLRETYYEDLNFRKTRKLMERAMNILLANASPSRKGYFNTFVLDAKHHSTLTKPIRMLVN